MKYWAHTFFLITALALTSCGKESFTSIPRSETSTVNQVQTFEQLTCSNHTLVKPPVDILFVVDNSSSSSYLTQDLKNQIAQTINSISQEFDYHALVAPLIATPGEANLTSFQLMVSSMNGLTNPTTLNIIPSSSVNFFATVTGNNQEHGFKRVKDIINANRTNGIFRTSSYTLVVMISNGDDTEVTQSIGGYQVADPIKMQSYKTLFEQYTKRYADTQSAATSSSLLKSLQFRFLSVIPHTQCLEGSKANQFYKEMSNHLYNYSLANDQNGRSTPDSYDMCSGAYSSLFSSVNASIQQFIVAHKYDHWLITNNSSALIDVNNIQVSKISPTGSVSQLSSSTTNGFQYIGSQTNKNTRYEPTPGEPATGLMIRLYGNARVQYPECVVIKTSTPIEYFGYIVIAQQPIESSIVVRVRGQVISQGGANGWEYVGFREMSNIKVPGPNGELDTPEVKKTGYFIKLNGTSKYASGDTVEIYFQGAPL
jgi:hypothetical protein